MAKKIDGQAVYNKLLWKLCASMGRPITINVNELENIPDNATLNAKYDPATGDVAVSAVNATPGGNILLPTHLQLSRAGNNGG